MSLIRRVSLFSLCLIAPLMPAIAEADDPAATLKAAQQTALADCAYDMRRTIADGDQTLEHEYAYNPAEARPLRLVSSGGDAPSAEEIASFNQAIDSRGDKPFTYGRTGTEAQLLAADFDYVRRDGDRLIFEANKLAKGTSVFMGTDISKQLRAELTVNIGGVVPFVEEAVLASKKSFRFKVVARINEAREVRSYMQTEDGKTYLARVHLTYNGSSLGSKIDEDHTRAFSNVDCG